MISALAALMTLFHEGRSARGQDPGGHRWVALFRERRTLMEDATEAISPYPTAREVHRA
ncbi:MAG: hypothetical protein OXD35_13245 [Thiotrichales bacterium]|nr:hypothetical protein [Thiotrichales bacterium]